MYPPKLKRVPWMSLKELLILLLLQMDGSAFMEHVRNLSYELAPIFRQKPGGIKMYYHCR